MQSSSGVYILVHEQRDKRATKLQIEWRRVLTERYVSQLDPFQLIVDFDKHYHEQQPLSSARPESSQKTAVVFRAGGVTYSLPISKALEIMPRPEVLTPLPMVKPWVAGLFSYQGVLYPVVHFASLFAGRKLSPNDESGDSVNEKLLLLRGEGMQCGLLVDEVVAVAAITASDDIIALDCEQLLCSHQLNRLLRE